MPANGLGVRGPFFGRAKEFSAAAARSRSISFDCFSNGRPLCSRASRPSGLPTSAPAPESIRAGSDWLFNRFEHAESQPSTVDVATYADTCIVQKEAPHLLDDHFNAFRHDTAVTKIGGGEILGRLVIVGFHQGHPAIEVCHRLAGKRLHFDRCVI